MAGQISKLKHTWYKSAEPVILVTNPLWPGLSTGLFWRRAMETTINLIIALNVIYFGGRYLINMLRETAE